MSKILKELGIDPTKMSALDIQDKLNVVKDKLQSSFKDVIKSIDDQIKKIGKTEFQQIDVLQHTSDVIDQEIKTLQTQLSEQWKMYYAVQDEIRNNERLIHNKPQVQTLEQQKAETQAKFYEYTKLLDKEVKRLTSKYIKNDLLESLKTINLLENKH